VERLTLRDAASRTGLSVTTLRRYIRAGRIVAEKSPGRYGPEYTIAPSALEDAGLGPLPDAAEIRTGAPPARPAVRPEGPATQDGARGQEERPASRALAIPETVLRDMVPIELYRELALKHEQLLVQYGMVRVAGQKLMEYKTDAERLAEALEETRRSAVAEREKASRDAEFLTRHLREAEIEIEERNQQLAALRARIRLLEAISRNAITNESIEHQYTQLLDKRLGLEELQATSSDERRRRMAALDDLLGDGDGARGREPEPIDQ
jgi:hypothetical protein